MRMTVATKMPDPGMTIAVTERVRFQNLSAPVGNHCRPREIERC